MDHRVELDTLFRAFLAARPLGLTLVLHEAGVVAVGPDEEELWRYDADIIEGYSLGVEELRLSFLTGLPEVEIDLLTGKVLS